MPLAKQLQIELAQAEVERSRAQLIETVSEFAELLEPKKIMSEVWESAKVKGADLAEDAVDAVKSRPLAVGGVVAALTMFFARAPIKDAAVKLYDAMTSSDEPKAKSAALKKENKPASPPARRRARKPATAARKTEKAT